MAEFYNGVVAAENATEEMTTENTTVNVDEQEQELIPTAEAEAYAPEIPEVQQEQAYNQNPDTTEHEKAEGIDPKVVAAGVAVTVAVIGTTAAIAKKAMPAIKEKAGVAKEKLAAKWAEHKEKKAQKLDKKANRLRGITEDPNPEQKKNENKK